MKGEAKPLPKQICFTDLTQFDKFVKEMNKIRECCSPGSSGNLARASPNQGIGGCCYC